MIKGKTIISSNEFNSSNTNKKIKPKLIKPTKILQSTLIKNEIKPEQENKTIISSTPINYIKETDTLYLNERYLKTKIPGYDPLFYKEVSYFLESVDIEITKENVLRNLNKFNIFGDNIQRRVQNIGEILDFVSKKTFNNIKDKYKQNKSILNIFKGNEIDFEELNKEIKDYFNDIVNILNDLKTKKESYFKNFEKLDFYYDCIKQISLDVVDMGIISKEELINTAISSKMTSLFASKQIVQQFKEIYKFEIESKTIELNNVKNYLDILKPSLELLKHNNINKFNQKLNDFINN